MHASRAVQDGGELFFDYCGHDDYDDTHSGLILRIVGCQLGMNEEWTCALDADKDGEMLPAVLAVPAGTEVSESMWDSRLARESGTHGFPLFI